jgi:processing peptidase subunit beta
MMADCALEPRSILAANVAMNKLAFSHETERKSGKHNDLDDLVMRNIYGDEGLGNNLLGDQSNIENLNAFTLQKFQVENYSTDKIIVSAAGVKNHLEFVELVNDKLHDLQYSGSLNQRNNAVFREGRVVVPQKSNSANVVVCLESSGWTGDQTLTAQVLETVLGGVEVNHFDSIVSPDGELYNSYYKTQSSVNAVEAFSQTFTDSGFFGLRLNVLSQELPGATRNLLSSVRNVVQNLTEEQFKAAKKRLAVRVTRALDQPEILIEEWARSSSVFGSPSSTLCSNLNDLNLKQFQKNALNLLKGKMNVTAQGGNVDQLPELSELKKLLA